MLKKICVLVCCLFIFKFFVFGQTILKVTPIVQKDPTWCWAATMEMVIKYRGNDTLDQCEIVQNFNRGVSCTCPTTSCTCPLCASCTTSNCSGGVSIADLKSHIISYKYNVKKSDGLIWDSIRGQIDTGLPFIVGLGCESGHLVTARGFRKMPQATGLKFMIVNDPYCCSGNSISEIRYFDNPNIKPEQSYCHFIYNIKQKTGYVQKIEFDTPLDCNAVQKRVSKNDTNALKADYQIVKVIMSGSAGQWIDVIKKQSCNAAYYLTRMKLIDGYWEPVFVMKQKDNPNVPIALFADGRTTVLSNDTQSDTSASVNYIPYTKVVSKDSPYEIYAFELNGMGKTPYFTPAHVEGEVLINGAYFKGGSVYRREDINFFLPNFKYQLKEPIKTPFATPIPTIKPKVNVPINKVKTIRN